MTLHELYQVESGGTEIIFEEHMPLKPGAELIGAGEPKVLEIAQDLGLQSVMLAAKNGSTTPQFSEEQWQQIAESYGEKAPAGYMTKSAMAKTAHIGKRRMGNIIESLDLKGQEFLTTGGHLAEHFSPEQYQRIIRGIGPRIKADETYQTMRSLKKTLGTSREFLTQIVDDFDIESEELLMHNCRAVPHYSLESQQRMERILKLWRKGGSPLDIVENLDTPPLITGLILENSDVKRKKSKPAEEKDFFNTGIDPATVQRFIKFRKREKGAIMQLQHRFGEMIPISYFAAKNEISIADATTLAISFSLKTFKVQVSETLSFACCRKDDIKVLEKAIATNTKSI